MSKNDGGPAFPVAPEHGENHWDGAEWRPRPGMSLRDYFAGQALQGAVGLDNERAAGGRLQADACRMTAERAYAYADAMLAAREKGDA